MFSYLGSHARVEGILILCRAHLLPPHHLLQTDTVIILEVAHKLPVNMSLNLKREGKREESEKRESGEQGNSLEIGCRKKRHKNHNLERGMRK